MVDPFDGLDSRKAAALRICVEKRQAALTAHRAYEAKAEQAFEALRVAKAEGLGTKRLAHAWKVSEQYIWKVTRKEKVVSPLDETVVVSSGGGNQEVLGRDLGGVLSETDPQTLLKDLLRLDGEGDMPAR